MRVTAAAMVMLSATARAEDPGASLTEPAEALARALECRGELRAGGRAPVLLVPGTGSSLEESFGFGYTHVLPKLGFALCTVRLPGIGLVDMQRSYEYVVYAIREVARRSGREVSLIGYSQGAPLAAYAPYFWPDLAAMIDDVIGLVGPYHGTLAAENACGDGACPVFAWQFRTGSKLNAAYRDRPQPAGPSYTAIATTIDELVTPAPQAARLEGASNIVIQHLCAARPIDHYLLVGDAVTFALALDALNHPGPADPSRFDPITCLQTIIPGADLAKAAAAPVSIASVIARQATAPDIDREPPLRCPFDARACPAPPPQLRMTRRCTGAGKLRIALAGDLDAVRDVAFKLGRRLVRRDLSAPFAGTLAGAVLRSTRRTRLRAIVNLAGPGGGRLILARSLARCGA